jgi:hypothetical protein
MDFWSIFGAFFTHSGRCCDQFEKQVKKTLIQNSVQKATGVEKFLTVVTRKLVKGGKDWWEETYLVP